MGWNNIFFLKKLDTIGNRLKKTILSSFHGSEPILNESGDFSFCINRENEKNQEKGEKEN